MSITKRQASDAFNMLCGEKIGGGVYRDVFTCKLRDDLVCKVEIDIDYPEFANIQEMKFWSVHEHYKKVSDWLAPCHFLSPNGWILLQRRCIPCVESDIDKMPKEIPAFLTDRKVQNFGWLDGRIVCLDYASTLQNPNVRLTKSEWW